MTKKELIEEWYRIVSINPDNIGMGIEEAIEDLANFIENGKRIENYLPDCSCLPDLDKKHMDSLKGKLDEMKCPFVRQVSKIIVKVIWGKIRTLPNQCMDGTLGIKSKDLQRACRKYKEPFEWMMGANLMEMTDDFYIWGKKTRAYRVNIPLILFYLGFANEDLEWSGARSSLKIKISMAPQKLPQSSTDCAQARQVEFA